MNTVTRRQFLATSAVMAAVTLTGREALAAGAPRLDPDAAQAKALAYVHQSGKAGQNCANCRLYTGTAQTEWGPCAIFPGKQVAGAGWCSAWSGNS